MSRGEYGNLSGSYNYVNQIADHSEKVDLLEALRNYSRRKVTVVRFEMTNRMIMSEPSHSIEWLRWWQRRWAGRVERMRLIKFWKSKISPRIQTQSITWTLVAMLKLLSCYNSSRVLKWIHCSMLINNTFIFRKQRENFFYSTFD